MTRDEVSAGTDDEGRPWYNARLSGEDVEGWVVYSEQDGFLECALFVSTNDLNQSGENIYTLFRFRDWRAIRSDKPNQYRPFAWEQKIGYLRLLPGEPTSLVEKASASGSSIVHYRMAIEAYNPNPVFQDSDFTFTPGREVPWTFITAEGEPVFHQSAVEQEIVDQAEWRKKEEREALLTKASSRSGLGGVSLIKIV